MLSSSPDISRTAPSDPYWWFSALACPACRGSLSRAAATARCASACGAGPWTLGAATISFLETAPYWGEVPQQRMREGLQQAEHEGWRAAVEGPLAGVRRSVEAANRADWLYELPSASGLDVLDLGSGLGQISYLLARAGHRVWSCEAVEERVDFQCLRRDQEGLADRLSVVRADIVGGLPFATGAFDLVVMNGVLEWVGIRGEDRSPRAVQLGVLCEVRRTLRPGGVLRIAIENRLGYQMFLGSLDHSGLPYTSLMPRWLANLTVRLAGRSGHRTTLALRAYRTYTYSPSGYRRLLREAGFGGVQTRWVLPGYNDPRVAGELEDRSGIRFLLHSLMVRGGVRRRLVLRTMCGLCALGFFKIFAPHLEISAGAREERA